MKLKAGFITHEIMGKQMMVAAGPAAEVFHGMVRSNKTAVFIVDCLKEETTKEAILKKMLDTYDVDETTAQGGIDYVVEKLESIGALE